MILCMVASPSDADYRLALLARLPFLIVPGTLDFSTSEIMKTSMDEPMVCRRTLGSIPSKLINTLSKYPCWFHANQVQPHSLPTYFFQGLAFRMLRNPFPRNG